MCAKAAGFFADGPDLSLRCDAIRGAGTHVLYVWTFASHDAVSARPPEVPGWEEWELDMDHKVRQSYGWFDAEAYARQAGG